MSVIKKMMKKMSKRFKKKYIRQKSKNIQQTLENTNLYYNSYVVKIGKVFFFIKLINME